MKKLSFSLVSFLFVGMVACGPGAKEKAAEQARLDSIAAVDEQRILDSIAESQALKTAEEVAPAAATEEEIAAPPQPAGTSRSRPAQVREADQSDMTRMRRAPEEAETEVVDSSTTRSRRGD